MKYGFFAFFDMTTTGTFTVFKQSDGSHRWLMVSSNAYRDNDGEIVSTKALDADVARMDATGNYGPLRWWHVPGLDIGDADFAAMHGRMRVESGTFRSKEIGEGVAREAGGLGVSLGFTHSAKEPDAEGVYHHINVFERSLLPRAKAANPFTAISVQGAKEMASLKEKAAEFVKTVFGGDAQKAKEFISGLDATQKSVEDAGVAFKEESAEKGKKAEMKADGAEVEIEAETEDTEDMSEEDMSEEDKGKGKTKEVTTKRGGESGPAERNAMFAAMHDEGTYDEGKTGGGKSDSGPYRTRRPKTPYSRRKKEEGGGEGDVPVTVGDLTPDEFVAVMNDWIQPITKELSAVTATKEAQAQAQAQQAVTLKEALETIETLKARIAALEGGTSRDVFFRASKAGAAPATNLTPPGESKQEKEVKGRDDFINWAVGGTRK